MKVLMWTNIPFFLAHGGVQTHMDNLLRYLPEFGVEAEPMRWWDQTQRGDLIHAITRPETAVVRMAHEKGMKFVMSDILDVTASRSDFQLFLQKSLSRAAKLLVGGLTGRMNWQVYQEVDALVFVLLREQKVAEYLFDAPPERCHVINHAVEPEALDQLAQAEAEGEHLISVATIAPRKNTLVLARAAIEAQVPIVFLGKPYAEDDPYFLEFKKLVDGKYVHYPGFVSREEKYRLLRSARGFCLLSLGETGCIAIHEASAAGLPLFLSDLPWARHGYTGAKRPLTFVDPSQPRAVVEALRAFHQQSHRQPHHTFPVQSWRDVAKQYAQVYKMVLEQKSNP